MSATDEKQIFNFENNFERALQSVLRAAGYYDALIQGANATLPESRIEIAAALGEPLNEAVHPLDPSTHIYDYFALRLSTRIVTVRPRTQPSLISGVSTLHEEWSAAVRVLMQERKSPFTLSNLPYYAVKKIQPLPTTRDLDPRWLEDFTKLEWLLEFGIRPDAWA